MVNSHPLTVSQLADPDSPSPLTPNHLLMMKSKVVFAPPGAFQPTDTYFRKCWRRVQQLANEFWTQRWKELLQQPTKWTRPQRNLSLDDTVIMIKDKNVSRSLQQLAHVSAVYPSPNGQVHQGASTVQVKGKLTPWFRESSTEFWGSNFENRVLRSMHIFSRNLKKDLEENENFSKIKTKVLSKPI